MEDIDTYLSNVWNEANGSEHKVEENFWEVCRLLEEKEFLVSDDASISTTSIGPFKIASTLEIKRKDFLVYFLETMIPAIFSNSNKLPFDQVYTLYLLPVASLFINLANRSFWIKDLLQWKILMYIKKNNIIGAYPTIKDIKQADEFRGFEEWQIDGAVNALKEFDNLLGDKDHLIVTDLEGRITCQV